MAKACFSLSRRAVRSANSPGNLVTGALSASAAAASAAATSLSLCSICSSSHCQNFGRDASRERRGGRSEPAADSPVLRDDLAQPVAEELWPQLPKNPNGQLDKSCFVYVAARDEYVCPNGRVLAYESRETRNGVVLNRYVCGSCADCPLAGRCLLPRRVPPGSADDSASDGIVTDARVRSLRRDEHEEVRQRTAARLATGCRPTRAGRVETN